MVKGLPFRVEISVELEEEGFKLDWCKRSHDDELLMHVTKPPGSDIIKIERYEPLLMLYLTRSHSAVYFTDGDGDICIEYERC